MRRLKLSAWIFWICALAPGVVYAEPDTVFHHPLDVEDPKVRQVASRLKNIEVLRAGFRQEKRIKVLSRPLLSVGELLFAKQHGLVWRMTSPFESTFVLTPNAILERREDRSTKKIAAQEQPVVHGFARILFAVFSGDLDTLQHFFQVFFLGSAEEWTIGLVPRDELMKKVVERVLLKGGRIVERVTLWENQDDQTVIEFKERSVDPADLSDEERRYFTESG